MILLSEFRFVKYWVASWGERAIPDSQRDLRMVSLAGWIVGCDSAPRRAVGGTEEVRMRRGGAESSSSALGSPVQRSVPDTIQAGQTHGQGEFRWGQGWAARF